MTNEDKINYLKDILSEINENDNAVCYLTSEDNELIKSAIEALEQQPCEDADSVSRKAVMETICTKHCTTYPYCKSKYGCAEMSDIKDLPSIQPKPKTGHWIPVSERLPKPRIDVWCNSDMGQMVGYYDEYVKTWYGRDYLELMVTAWMPLPEQYEP
jgi:hypothetical protein